MGTVVGAMRFLGIDPGVSGGLAVLDELGIVLHVGKMPDSERDLLDVLLETSGRDFVSERTKHTRAMLELVHPMPKHMTGGNGNFTLGQSKGTLRMALVAAGIPFDEVSPVKWQTAMQCRTGGDKNISKRRASELFPGVKVTHAIADSLLLAEYCRRLEVRP